MLLLSRQGFCPAPKLENLNCVSFGLEYLIEIAYDVSDPDPTILEATHD